VTVLHVVRKFGELSETFVTDLVADLDRLGWESWVVARSVANRHRFPFPPPERLLTASGSPPGRRVLDRVAMRTSAERRSAGLSPAIARVRPALIHAHFGWAAADVRLAAARAGVPMLATFHGSDLTAFLGPGRRRDYARLFRQVDHVITVSRFLEGRVRSLGYEGAVHVVPGGVRLSRLRFREPSAGGGDARLIFIGRQIECKGLDTLLQALCLLGPEYAGVRLEVIGDGPMRADNERLAADLGVAARVDFRGALPKDHVVEALRRADVLVAPSRTAAGGQAEGRSVVAMEALATGLPVVATDNGGLPETIPPSLRHELVPEGDAGALAARIGRVLHDRAGWSARARAGRAWAEEQFDSELLARRVARIYETVLEEGGRLPAASSRAA
jgi:colanic acid/amylovoran biosynthesis glycosyltransferase